MTWSLASTLLLLSGDVELNPGPKKGAAKDAGPTPEQKISELEGKVQEYQDKIQGLEKDLETQKEESKSKLASLETQMSQVTSDLAQLKENDKNAELSSKLNQISSDLGEKMSAAEVKMAEFMESFEKFQAASTEAQNTTGKKIEDVEVQIKSFQSSSEGTVQDVLEDAENLKVRKLKNSTQFYCLIWTLKVMI